MEGILCLPPAATLGSTVFAALDEMLPAAPWRRMLHGRMATRQLLRQQTSTAGSWQAGSHHHAKLVFGSSKKISLGESCYLVVFKKVYVQNYL